MKKLIVICSLLIICLMVFTSCTGTLPSSQGLSFTIRVLSRTAYTATIEMTIRNYSHQSFSMNRVTMRGCNTAGNCASEQEVVPPWMAVQPPQTMDSAIETLIIGYPGQPRVAWMEIIIEGVFADGRYASASSGRVRF